MMFSTAVCGFGKDRSSLQISAMPARFLRATVPWSPIKTAFGVTFYVALKKKDTHEPSVLRRQNRYLVFYR